MRTGDAPTTRDAGWATVTTGGRLSRSTRCSVRVLWPSASAAVSRKTRSPSPSVKGPASKRPSETKTSAPSIHSREASGTSPESVTSGD